MNERDLAQGSKPSGGAYPSTRLDQALSKTPSRRIHESEAGGIEVAAIPRLRNLAVVLASITTLFAFMVTLVHFGVITSLWRGPTHLYLYVTLAVAFVGSMAMIFVTRLTHWTPQRVVHAGSVFQVFGALVLSIGDQLVAQSTSSLSVVCIWILTFPLVPTSPRRAAAAAFTSAATGPLALLLFIALGDQRWPPEGYEVWRFVPSFMSAAIAVFINRMIHGLGRQVADAKSLGAYHLVEILGHGGMGEVWRAEHQSLIRPAAVKLLRREMTSSITRHELEQMNLRFQREVQATALLTSPHTVAVYDFGQTHDGTLYYVMELLNGLDAETLVTRYGPQPAERVIYLLRQACESLAEAHHRDLIHRDIKPANVYLCAVGLKVDFVKILDFGLVRDLNSSVNLTNEGSVSGTPAYLAPEAAAQNKFDARGDLYALGCVAYFMLTGNLVFEGATAAAVMAAHIRDQPVPPSQRTEVPIPPELEQLILDCLAKDPAKRPQTAEELRHRLEQIPLTKKWTQRRAGTWWTQHHPDLIGRARTTCVEGMPAAKVRHRQASLLMERATSRARPAPRP
jgi:eukaryotic-like serine/threonine-protein kinase